MSIGWVRILSETLVTSIKRLKTLYEGNLDIYSKILAADALRSAYILNDETTEAESIARVVIDLGTKWVNFDEATLDSKRTVLSKMFDAYVTLAPNDFHSFLMALEWNRDPRERFYQPRMKVLHPIVDAMTDMMVYDKYDIMMLSMPPGTGKSTLGLFFLLWVIGRRPQDCNLAIGYSTPMAKSFFSRVSSIDKDVEYMYHTIFPQLTRVYTSAKELELDWSNDSGDEKKPFCSLTCASVEGSLTGRTRCEGVLYCDDLVEGAETAMSATRLDKLWTLYTDNAHSRKKEGCKELHIGTRWSLLDPIGRLMIRNEDNPRCKIVSLAALDENGQSNFEYEYGVGFSTKMFEEIRSLTNQLSWNALYMQRPMETEGLLFPVDSLKRFVFDEKEFWHNPPDEIFAFCDVAFGGTDYLAMPILAQWGTDPPLVVDVVFMRGSYEVTEPVVLGKILSWNVQRVCFEANNGGDFYAEDVKNLLKEKDYHCAINTLRAGTRLSKAGRIIQHQPAILSFRFRKQDNYPEDGQYGRFMQNLVTYTADGKNEHDDAPDACAGVATMMRTNMRAKIRILTRKNI